LSGVTSGSVAVPKDRSTWARVEIESTGGGELEGKRVVGIQGGLLGEARGVSVAQREIPEHSWQAVTPSDSRSGLIAGPVSYRARRTPRAVSTDSPITTRVRECEKFLPSPQQIAYLRTTLHPSTA
jgi:hypothetical protein